MTYAQDTKGPPPKIQTAAATPKSIKLKRETRDHQTQGRRNHAQTILRVLEAVDRNAIKAIVAACANIRAIAAIISKLFYGAFRGGHPPIAPSSTAPRPVGSATWKSAPPVKTSMLGRLALSACLGLTAFCAIMVLILLLEMRDSAVKIDKLERDLAMTRARLGQLERTADAPQPVPKEASPEQSRPSHLALSLATPEIKLIRESIKILPPKADAKGTVHLGDEVSDLTSVPVPDSLVEQLPKLRGARFSIDQNGAIIIIAPGSKQADAVISYR